MQIQTIKIKSDNELGYRYVNYNEFDQDTQELYGVEIEDKPVVKVAAKTKVSRQVTVD